MSPPPTSVSEAAWSWSGFRIPPLLPPSATRSPLRHPPWAFSSEVKHPFVLGAFRGAGGPWFASLVTSSLSQVAVCPLPWALAREFSGPISEVLPRGHRLEGPGTLSHGKTGRGVSTQSLATETGPLGGQQSPHPCLRSDDQNQLVPRGPLCHCGCFAALDHTPSPLWCLGPRCLSLALLPGDFSLPGDPRPFREAVWPWTLASVRMSGGRAAWLPFPDAGGGPSSQRGS